MDQDYAHDHAAHADHNDFPPLLQGHNFFPQSHEDSGAGAEGEGGEGGEGWDEGSERGQLEMDISITDIPQSDVLLGPVAERGMLHPVQ
jgi:hypothetical protein